MTDERKLIIAGIELEYDYVEDGEGWKCRKCGWYDCVSGAPGGLYADLIFHADRCKAVPEMSESAQSKLATYQALLHGLMGAKTTDEVHAIEDVFREELIKQ